MLVIPVIFQKNHTVLNCDCCYQTVYRIPNGATFSSKLSINCSRELKSGAIVVEINEPFEESLGGYKIILFPDSLQSLGQYEATAADILSIPNAFFEGCDLF